MSANNHLVSPTLNTVSRDLIATHSKIAHIGMGNFHRSHQACYVDRYMRQERDLRWGITGIGIHPMERPLHAQLRQQDLAYSLILKDNYETSVVINSALHNLLHIDDQLPDASAFIAKPSTSVVTLTITEGGYYINQNTGEFSDANPDIQHDLTHHHIPKTIYGFLLGALYQRQKNKAGKLTLVSCDNIAHNGRKFRNALYEYARLDGRVSSDWLDDTLTFPSTMVDRITPRSEEQNVTICREHGLIDHCPVAAEPFCQWIIEDNFCSERPAWEAVGATLVHDVLPYENIKLRLLNASHQALAYFGLLSGIETVSTAMHSPLIRNMITRFMSEEASFGLDSLPGLCLADYQIEVVQRFGNIAIKDTLTRIASFSSDRVMSFVMPIIHDNLAQGQPAPICAGLLAAWMRYCKLAMQTNTFASPEDNSLALLGRLVTALDNDPKSIFTHSAFFGSVAGYPAFHQQFETCYRTLTEQGIDAMLSAL